ncbi:MAG TPA: hypothetical protein VF476_18540 [Chitinophagaceae bacterium]
MVNGTAIFPLLNTEPVVIALMDDHPAIVVTDGFHITQPLELNFKEPSYYNFKLVCAISDLQLLGGFFLLAFLYLLGFFTGFFLLKLLSFTPILLFLFWYYINRRNFLRLVPVR